MTVPIAGIVTRRVKRERPDFALDWTDSITGELIDFTGYTFRFSIALAADAPALLVKTSGISYVGNTGDFNVQITFSPGELDGFVANIPYNCQLDAVSGSVDRGFQDFILLFTPEHS